MTSIQTKAYWKKEEVVKTQLNKNNQLITIVKNKTYLCPIDYNEGGVITDIIDAAEESLKTYKEYGAVSSEFKFRKLPVYGTIDNPLFFSKCVYEYLYPEKNGHNNTFIPKFGKTKDKYDNYLIKCDAVIPNENGNKKGQHNVNLLNELGLMKSMVMVSTPFGIAFQNIMLGFLRAIRNNHRNLFVKTLTEERDTYKKNMELEGARADSAEVANTYNRDLGVEFEKFRECFDEPDIHGDPRTKELIALRHIHMKFIDVYVVDEEYMKAQKVKLAYRNKPKPTKEPTSKAKKLKEKKPRKHEGDPFYELSDSDDSPPEKNPTPAAPGESKSTDDKLEALYADDLYELPFTCYNWTKFKTSEYAQDELYFTVGPWANKKLKNSKIFHKFMEIPIANKAHYTEMLLCLNNKKINTCVKGIYKCTYDEIIDSREKSLTEKFVGPLFTELRNNRKFREF
jgi:hypothetical protein